MVDIRANTNPITFVGPLPVVVDVVFVVPLVAPKWMGIAFH